MKNQKYLPIFLCMLLALLIALYAYQSANSGPNPDLYLSTSAIQSIMGMAPAPPPDVSEEHQAELELVKRAEKAAPSAEIDIARGQFKFGPQVFQPAIGPWFDKHHAPKTWALLQEVKTAAGPVIDGLKLRFKRKRPPACDSEIEAMDRANFDQLSYPSGHSFFGTLFALILSEILPEKAAALKQTGQEIGWHRIVAGMHHPSDVVTARVLATAVFLELTRSRRFQHQLSQAKAELQSLTSANSS